MSSSSSARSPDLQGALQVAEAILQEVSALRVPTGDSRWSGSVSIGVAEKTPEMKHFEDIIKASDQGVLLAKKAGKSVPVRYRNRTASIEFSLNFDFFITFAAIY